MHAVRLKSFTALLIVFLTNHEVSGQDADCDYYQNVAQGQTYYVYSKNYPNSYSPNSVCRWQASCPANTQCRISCTLEIPATTGCSGDRFLVSRTGDTSLTGAESYCGTGTLAISSTSNQMSMGLVVTANTAGGRFLCELSAQPKTPDPTQCQCGWKKDTRIVGGQETKVNEYPMMVGLIDITLRRIYCGATIVSQRWVVTAAHCLQEQQVDNVGVLYGEHNVMTGAETDAATLIRAQQFTMHPQYNGEYDYDIALIYTAESIIFSDNVGPACLPFKYASTTFANYVVQALGWGTTSFAGPDSDYLQKVDLDVIDQTTCINTHGSVITDRTLCTYSPGKDSCQHDSGGPIVWQDSSSGRVYLLGIIMGGYGCASTRPGLNSRVTQYLDWITNNAVGADFCKN